MNLWIRSQDSTKIVNCNDIAIKAESEDAKTVRGYTIVGYFDKETEYEELGFYISLKSALMVLDKIQTRIAVLNTFEMFDCKNDIMAGIFQQIIPNSDLTSAAYPFQMPLDLGDYNEK